MTLKAWPVQDDPGDVREGLDVVDAGGAAPQALVGGERRAHPRHAALALDGPDERGLLAADEGAGALLELDVELEVGAVDLVAQQVPLLGLLDGDVQPLDGLGVLGAAVDVAVGRADA